MEFFAGCNVVTRIMRCTGRKFAAFDIDYFSHYQKRGRRSGRQVPGNNFFDILSPAGFISAIVAILCCKPTSVIVLAVVCGSWVSVSRGTTTRTWLDPLGDPTINCVVKGNLLASRRILCPFLNEIIKEFFRLKKGTFFSANLR